MVTIQYRNVGRIKLRHKPVNFFAFRVNARQREIKSLVATRAEFADALGIDEGVGRGNRVKLFNRVAVLSLQKQLL